MIFKSKTGRIEFTECVTIFKNNGINKLILVNCGHKYFYQRSSNCEFYWLHNTKGPALILIRDKKNPLPSFYLYGKEYSKKEYKERIDNL